MDGEKEFDKGRFDDIRDRYGLPEHLIPFRLLDILEPEEQFFQIGDIWFLDKNNVFARNGWEDIEFLIDGILAVTEGNAQPVVEALAEEILGEDMQELVNSAFDRKVKKLMECLTFHCGSCGATLVPSEDQGDFDLVCPECEAGGCKVEVKK